MDSFYQNLHKGKDKGTALHHAKLEYINSDFTDQQGAHPFYWSAYTLMGNPKALEIPTKNNWWMWLLGIGAVGLFVFFIKKKF